MNMIRPDKTQNTMTGRNSKDYNSLLSAPCNKKSQNRSNLLVIRNLNSIISDIKGQYLNKDDYLMMRVLYNFNKGVEMYNTENIIKLWEILSNMVNYLGRIKIEYEKEKELKQQEDISDYEVELQKQEAKNREHIKVEQQLKLFIESLQAKLLGNVKLRKADIIRLGKEKNSFRNKFNKSQEAIHRLEEKLIRYEEKIKELEIEIESKLGTKTKFLLARKIERVMRRGSKDRSIEKVSIKPSFLNSKNNKPSSTFDMKLKEKYSDFGNLRLSSKNLRKEQIKIQKKKEGNMVLHRILARPIPADIIEKERKEIDRLHSKERSYTNMRSRKEIQNKGIKGKKVSSTYRYLRSGANKMFLTGNSKQSSQSFLTNSTVNTKIVKKGKLRKRGTESQNNLRKTIKTKREENLLLKSSSRDSKLMNISEKLKTFSSRLKRK